ncbi:helix-turn-helix domain-containing protein [Enterococcus diestrammenae]|uniref:helix-turn-helix domain-containing protein n=1 Tax=Enterococcus diestrammenae TaxID=1155073 RepID=UPI0022E8F36A|nr:helix-turn-helix transcriptional regulator [Enterococcus diestrammenae]
MTVFDRIKELSERRGISIQKAAIDMGFSENLFYQWKNAQPKADRLEKVADYFGVSVDYLLGREEQTKKDPLTYYRMDTSGMTEDQIKILREKLEFAERLAREDIRRAKGE